MPAPVCDSCAPPSAPRAISAPMRRVSDGRPGRRSMPGGGRTFFSSAGAVRSFLRYSWMSHTFVVRCVGQYLPAAGPIRGRREVRRRRCRTPREHRLAHGAKLGEGAGLLRRCQAGHARPRRLLQGILELAARRRRSRAKSKQAECHEHAHADDVEIRGIDGGRARRLCFYEYVILRVHRVP